MDGYRVGQRLRQRGRHGGVLVVLAVRANACKVRQLRKADNSHKEHWLSREQLRLCTPLTRGNPDRARCAGEAGG